VVQGCNAPQGHPQPHAGDLTTFNEPIWSEPFYNAVLPAEPFFNQERDIPASNPTTAIDILDIDIESNSASSRSSERESGWTRTSLSICEGNAQSGIEVSREDAQFEACVEALAPLSVPKLNTSDNDSYLSRESISVNHVNLSSRLILNLTLL
jgi:hypothetical protein